MRLSEAIVDHEILPQPYTICKEDRGTCGGGVLLAISSDLPSRELPSSGNLEVVNVSVSFSDIDVTFYMVYAPPNATIEYHSDLSNYLTSLTTIIAQSLSLVTSTYPTSIGQPSLHSATNFHQLLWVQSDPTCWITNSFMWQYLRSCFAKQFWTSNTFDSTSNTLSVHYIWPSSNYIHHQF